LADYCRNNVVALLHGATPSFYLPGEFDGNVSGLTIRVGPAESRERVECSQLVPRPELPLQSTLFRLCETAAQGLAMRRLDPKLIPTLTLGLTVLLDPAMHGTAEDPDLASINPRHRAVAAHSGSSWAWYFDPAKTPGELLEQAMEAIKPVAPPQVRVMSLAVVSTEPRVAAALVPRPQPGPEVRPPAVAGAFYPATPEEIGRMLDKMLPEKPRTEPWSAVLVPHAGWVYSGELAAKTLSRVEIPEQVIVFCPKHRPGGAQWAVAPHRAWAVPGGEVPSDPDLARRLAEKITGLQIDAVAHRQEHAIEVQLPLLARLAPQAKVVGITIGGGDLPSLQRFGKELAEVLKELPKRPLLIISSDMNHFADAEATRRLDRQALDAVESLDPAKVYETVAENRISMCGIGACVIVMEALKHLDSLKRCQQVGYTTSAESSGDNSRVVGYAGMLLG
jgi:AmmeMemoRadiSam system protein B